MAQQQFCLKENQFYLILGYNYINIKVYWRIFSEYNVKSCFTAPTALRAIRKEDPNGEYIKKYDLENFKYLFVAGERCDSK